MEMKLKSLLIFALLLGSAAGQRRPVPATPSLSIAVKLPLHSGTNNLLTVALKGMAFNLKELHCESSDTDVAYIGDGELWVSGILPGHAQIQCSYRGIRSNKVEVETIK